MWKKLLMDGLRQDEVDSSCRYISELSPSAYRGRLVTLSVLLVTAGQVISYSVGWIFSTREHGWRFMVGFGAVPAVLQFGLLILLPETPRWLVRNEEKERARSVLRQVYSESDAVADQVLQAISSEVSEEISTFRLIYTSASDGKSPAWLTKHRVALVELSSNGSSRRALTIACLLQGLQQLCGFVRISSPSICTTSILLKTPSRIPSCTSPLRFLHVSDFPRQL